jgi:hypothetical protein
MGKYLLSLISAFALAFALAFASAFVSFERSSNLIRSDLMFAMKGADLSQRRILVNGMRKGSWVVNEGKYDLNPREEESVSKQLDLST